MIATATRSRKTPPRSTRSGAGLCAAICSAFRARFNSSASHLREARPKAEAGRTLAEPLRVARRYLVGARVRVNSSHVGDVFVIRVLPLLKLSIVIAAATAAVNNGHLVQQRRCLGVFLEQLRNVVRDAFWEHLFPRSTAVHTREPDRLVVHSREVEREPVGSHGVDGERIFASSPTCVWSPSELAISRRAGRLGFRFSEAAKAAERLSCFVFHVGVSGVVLAAALTESGAAFRAVPECFIVSPAGSNLSGFFLGHFGVEVLDADHHFPSTVTLGEFEPGPFDETFSAVPEAPKAFGGQPFDPKAVNGWVLDKFQDRKLKRRSGGGKFFVHCGITIPNRLGFTREKSAGAQISSRNEPAEAQADE